MELFVLLAVVALVAVLSIPFLWVVAVGARSRGDMLAARLAALDGAESLIAALRRRVDVLEQDVLLLRRSGEREPAPPPVPLVHRTMPTSAPPVASPTPAASPTRPVPVPVVPPSQVPTSEPALNPTPAMTRPPVVAAPVALQGQPAMDATAAPANPTADPADASTDGWEVVVGTSWLNKIGVFTFVLGLALLLGYSFTKVGPLGRVALGYAVSFALLGTGIALQKREAFRAYGHGLVAGGWAAVYFTTYAMHGVDAARIIDDPIVASVTLLVVAAALVAHSLQYRSEALTATAYFVAFGTMTLTPSSGFALVASLPLTASVVFVAHRFGWMRLLLVGLVATYGALVSREVLFAGRGVDPQSLTRYLVLGGYWLLFEWADIARRRTAAGSDSANASTWTDAAAPLMPANAAALFGAILLQWPSPQMVTPVVGTVASAYLVSGLVRRRLHPSPLPSDEAAQPFTSSHAAMLVSAVVFVALMHLQLAGHREALALAVEAEVLFAAGLSQRDKWVRLMGAVLMGVSAVFVIALLSSGLAWFTAGLSVDGATVATGLLVIVALAVNDEWLHRRGSTLSAIEETLPWAALLLAGECIVWEVEPAFRGLVGLAVALVLVEAGRVGRRRWRPVAAAAAIASALAAFMAFPPVALLSMGPTSVAALWRALPATIVLAYAFALRAGKIAARPGAGLNEGDVATLVLNMAAVLLGLFAYHVVPEPWLGAAWATTGLTLAFCGRLNAAAPLQAMLQRQGPIFAVAAMVWVGRAWWWFTPAHDAAGISAAVLGMALAYATGLAYRSGLTRHTHADDTDRKADLLLASLTESAATLTFVMFKMRVLPAAWVPAGSAATAGLIVGAGVWRRLAWQRVQGYLLAGFAGSLVLVDTMAPDPHIATAAAVCVVIVLYLIPFALRGRLSAIGASADEALALSGLSLLATCTVVLVEQQTIRPEWVSLAWSFTALPILAIGLWRPEGRPLRMTAYALLTLAGIRAIDLAFAPSDAAHAIGTVIEVVLLYTASLAARRVLPIHQDRLEPWEDRTRAGIGVMATILVTVLIQAEASAAFIVAAWGLTGGALLLIGFLLHERLWRLSGLGLFALCVLRLLYVLPRLDAFGRILSLVVLGLVLLGVSWIYTRFKDQMKQWL